ncbi:MAG: sulfotransferase [Candidatus Binataceae bacterium]|nr:sulfotransferase [Candidatus Binataceae bacterium]
MPRFAKERVDEGAALPNFIGVGPPRTGTTWLDQILRGHVNLPAGIKETLFFDVRYPRGIEWYAYHFRNRRPGVPTGEFGPSYFSSDAARERLARHIPDCKIICTLREPVARHYSNYKMWRKMALVKEPFARIAERHKDLLAYARYTENITEWQRIFGRENVLVLILEDARRSPQQYIDTICSFIGAERLNLAGVAHVGDSVNGVDRAPKYRRMARRARKLRGFLGDHRYWRTRRVMNPVFDYWMGRGAEFPPLDPALESRLRQRFKPEIAALEELLGRDLSCWRETLAQASMAQTSDSRRTGVRVGERGSA